MTQTFKDFVEFIRTHGVIGLAVGFVIGKAISDLVGSLVADIINPVVGIALNNFGDLSTLSLHILNADIMYGRFISILINFVIIAFVVYFGVKKLKFEKLDKPKV